MRKLLSLFIASTLLVGVSLARGASAYPEPPGGWTYVTYFDQLIRGADGSGFSSLDGTWSHDNASDAWDGSGIGGEYGPGNGPGGASLLTQDGVTFVRMQSTGDPRGYGYPDPSNRKIYFGHDIENHLDKEIADSLMDDGVTLTFRARIPTAAKASIDGEFLIDPLHPAGQGAIRPYPEDGDGYVASDGGKGNFVIRQAGAFGENRAGGIAFNFTTALDTTGGDPNVNRAGIYGLTFNEFNGNVPTSQVNFGQGTATNVVIFDPTEWTEIYMVMHRDPANLGTHEIFIFLNGSLTPQVFKITAGTGKDVEVDNFLAIGGSATPQSFALDYDWFGFKVGKHFPPGSIDNIPPSITEVSIPPNAMFQPAASGLAFRASTHEASTNSLPVSGFSLILNDQDLSSGLNVTGPEQNRSVTYSALQPNQFYRGAIIVADQAGRKSTNELSFDTFVETAGVVIESEDYNYGSGQFIANPVPGSYAGQQGVAGVDFFDTTGDPNDWRQDAVNLAASTDFARAKFTPATNERDSMVNNVQAGEWLNYTRNFSAGRHLAYLRYSGTTSQNLRLDKVTGATSANQTLSTVGTFIAPRTGNLNLFRYVPLTDAFGAPLSVPLSGAQTVRLTAIQANNDLNHNLLFFVPDPDAAAASIAVASAFPAPDQVNVRAGSTFRIGLVDGAHQVVPGSVKLWFDGASVTPTVTDTADGVLVTYNPGLLQGQRPYSMQIEFADNAPTPMVVSQSWAFTTAGYANVPPELGTPIGTGADPGMRWRSHQLAEGNTATIALAEQQLAGALGPSVHIADDYGNGVSWTGPQEADGFFAMNFINLELNATAAGNFNATAAAPQNVADDFIPGINTLVRPGNNVAAECFAYLEFTQPGLYEMVVNSDDGFLVTTGNRENPTFLTLGSFDGGRSAADSVFQVGIAQPGVYLFRLLWFQGGGGASVEWFTVNPDGSRALINGTQAGAIRSFQRRTVAEPELPQPPVEVPMGVTFDGAAGEVVITWDAAVQSLQESTDLQSWNNVTGASPYRVAPTGPAKYYRLLVSP